MCFVLVDWYTNFINVLGCTSEFFFSRNEC